MHGPEWTLDHLEFVRALKENKNAKDWADVLKHFKAKFPEEKRTIAGIRRAYYDFRDNGYTRPQDQITRDAKRLRTARRTSSFNAREARYLLDQVSAEGNVLEKILENIEKIKRPRRRLPKFRRNPKRWDMRLELLLSDLHFGSLIELEGKILFNEEIARARMKEIARVVLAEIDIQSKTYNVTGLIVALLGDIIESYEMHGLESARSCEYGTAKQIWASIDIIFHEIIIPLAETGLPIEIPAVTGNHDRSEAKKTFNNPGDNNWTYIIYKALEALTYAQGYRNVNFRIPAGPYCVLEVFGMNILYEHLDNAKGKNFTKLMTDRGRQVNRFIDALRGGHWHEMKMDGNGRVIVNMSLIGRNSYADVLGYDCEAGQVLNSYLNFPLKLRPKQRKNAFHKTFGIKLE